MKSLLTIVLLLAAALAFAGKSELHVAGRRFVVVSPNVRPATKRPLLLLLHGCKQSPEIILEGTGLGDLATRKSFYVLAPEQTVFENIDHCWNWFLSYEQTRSSPNQMGQIIAGIVTMIRNAEVDPEQIYLAGISAGGAMGHNLTSCYPDIFKGAAISAGLAYKIAEDLYEASTVLESNHFKKPAYLGKQAFLCGAQAGKRRLAKVLLIHGEADRRVDPFHSRLISDVNYVTLDFYDDGRMNGSPSYAEVETQTTLAGGYGVLVRDRQYAGLNFSERMILVKGMSHAWGGGKPLSANFDPKAPSTNDFIQNFFQL